MTSNPTRPPRYAVAVEIPPGYHELPLAGVATAISAADPLLSQQTTGTLRESVPKTLGTLEFMLEALAKRNAVYCGIGTHRSADGHPVVSWLTISCLDAGAPRNPRLTLADIAQHKTRDEIGWRVEGVDVGERPLLFSEGIGHYPSPDLPALRKSDDAAHTYQMEAVIPSPDGTTVAVVEVATAEVDRGPEFGPMLFGMAASLEFVASSTTPSLDL
ncbi:hypothetical protein [Nocardia ignorata]|uniref:Uncharacterized protein n=1 Tax=Nocardia ignorata TaxID=145285 RepID=A0A4V3CQN1_NOCIG|nr:hypothetical protein [Nocardia ignorata]TDP42899.1 hypothetical protein DFR75_1012017 [Nocardia ignorata]